MEAVLHYEIHVEKLVVMFAVEKKTLKWWLYIQGPIHLE